MQTHSCVFWLLHFGGAVTPKGFSGKDRAGSVLSLMQLSQAWEGSGEDPFFPSSSRQKGRSGSAHQVFRVQACTMFLCWGLGGGGGNLAAHPLWKGSSCLRRNSSHSFAVKKVLTCSGVFAEQVKTSQRQLLSAGRKWPIFSSLGLDSRSGFLGKVVPGGTLYALSNSTRMPPCLLPSHTAREML